MDPEWLLSVMKIFRYLGGKMVSFSGGEPLCHQSLSMFIESAKNIKLKTRITTNFLLFNIHLTKLINNLDCIHISIPVISPKEYAEISGSLYHFSLSDFIYKITYLINMGKEIRINSIYLEKYEKLIIEAIKFFISHNIPVNIMNDMYGNKEYMKNYNTFCNFKLNSYNNVSFRTSTNPGWNICKNCEYIHNCASTRAIWCFPDYSIGLCPQKKNLRYICKTKNDIKTAFNYILTNINA